MNPKYRQLLLGGFFVTALSILAFYTLVLTDFSLFSKPILMTVYFEDANNLRKGDPVLLLGARIGRVKDVEYDVTADKSERIRTVLSLDQKVELLEDGEISIRETSLLGGRHVFINPGTFGGPAKPPLEGGGYHGTVHKNPIAMLGDIGTLLNENRESITNAFRNISTITEDIAQSRGLLGRVINDPGLGEDGRAIVADARTFMADLTDASGQLKSGNGLIGALLYDDKMKQQFSDTVESLRKIGADLEAQKGLLGALIYDPELRDRIKTGVDAVVSFVEKLDNGEGALQMLLTDKELKEQARTLVADLSATAADVRTVVADVKNGQGTIGKLLRDDTVYAQLEKTLGVLTRSLEDYREAAPITSFTSVLFAAF